MLLNLVAKIKLYTQLYDFLWLYYYDHSWFLYDLISFWWYICSGRNHIILLLMFVAEKVLLLLVISLTAEANDHTISSATVTWLLYVKIFLNMSHKSIKANNVTKMKQSTSIVCVFYGIYWTSHICDFCYNSEIYFVYIRIVATQKERVNP